ncbi:MAG: hypothetical protein ABR575_05300 [Actinomycetota bacterium]
MRRSRGYGVVVTVTGTDQEPRTRAGEPLPAGEYLAALEIEGRSGRFLEPVTVTQ